MTKPLAVAGGFFWITMNIIETVDNFLTEHKIIKQACTFQSTSIALRRKTRHLWII
jgi:hypothetical protein